MKIGIGSDHGGFNFKQELIEHYGKKGIDFVDFGIESEEMRDYNDVANAVCKAVLDERIDMGVLICGSGIGMSIAANRFKGIYAAILYNDDVAHLAKEHNNANVAVFAGRLMNLEDVIRRLDIFLASKYLGGRYQQRIDKLDI